MILTMQNFLDAYITLQSGCAEIFPGKGIKLTIDGNFYYIDFKNNNLEYAIVRTYWYNGLIQTEREYLNGKLHGNSFAWYSNGKIRIQIEYKEGFINGSSVFYYKDGRKNLKEEWINGKQISIKYF